ncbi:hypothetical protein [Paenibacillus agilis]|uniref:hypothetical protein n=1 Tax=Paenibacillus agilis TaxID=3020863 RepID=UPI0021BD156D|nr:hypothetical protein [Paenibacillus agilis]
MDWDNFVGELDGERDYELEREDWEMSLETFVGDFTEKYKTFSECDIWTSRDEKAVLESTLFYIVVQDNEWSMAIKLIQKEQDYCSKGNFENLQKGLYQKYLEGIKQCLFNQFEELGIYGGAWTSGTIRKQEVA